jgi:hypothetical protein
MDSIATETGAASVPSSTRLALAQSTRRPARRSAGHRLAKLFAIIAAMAVLMDAAAAQSPQLPRLETNQAYVEEVTRPASLAVTDPMAVFSFVLGSLPDRVTVYPTENYYYFNFIHQGVRYAGNIRIEPQDSGGQTVHFIYYEDMSEWREDTADYHIVLEPSHGVTVEKIDRLLYRIAYRDKSVLFALNDLSQVKPPAAAINPNERFIGPIFDESGVRFFLVYSPKLKNFHYILDETVSVADAFFSPPVTDRILIGKRTGFAFYRDHHLDRKILIGAHESNMRLNTYFDGPFDQLPDNFIEGEALRDAILEIQPNLKGKIDRFGSDPSGEVRFGIDPYVPYKKVDDLYAIHRCALGKLKAATYYSCFASRLGGLPSVEPTIRKSTRKSKTTGTPKQNP